MPEGPKRIQGEVSKKKLDFGFREYLSRCIDGGFHLWGTSSVVVKVKEGGHAYVNECTTCFKITRTPISA